MASDASTQALLVDGHGRVTAMTTSAGTLLTRNRRLRLRDGALESPVRVETQRLARAMGQTVRGELTDGADFLLPALDVDRGALRVAVRPMVAGMWEMGFAPLALVVLHANDPAPAEDCIRLVRHYGFTAAEAEVAAALAAGISRATIAGSRGVSIATIRAQLKTIFLKAGVNREAELVARLAAAN